VERHIRVGTGPGTGWSWTGRTAGGFAARRFWGMAGSTSRVWVQPWQYFIRGIVQKSRPRYIHTVARVSVKYVQQHHSRTNIIADRDVILGADIWRFVSFCFTNMSDLITYFYLKKGFKERGILNEALNNVKDVNKLLEALNNVAFGQFCVWTKVSRFDRFTTSPDKLKQKDGVRGEGVLVDELGRKERGKA